MGNSAQREIALDLEKYCRDRIDEREKIRSVRSKINTLKKPEKDDQLASD